MAVMMNENAIVRRESRASLRRWVCDSNLGKTGAPHSFKLTVRDCRPAQTSKTVRDLRVSCTCLTNLVALLHTSSKLTYQSAIKMGNEAGPGVGFEFPSFEVKWLKRDLLLFAASIGATYPDELQFLYVSITTRLQLL
jgi:hypothetical protein